MRDYETEIEDSGWRKQTATPSRWDGESEDGTIVAVVV